VPFTQFCSVAKTIGGPLFGRNPAINMLKNMLQIKGRAVSLRGSRGFYAPLDASYMCVQTLRRLELSMRRMWFMVFLTINLLD
jgi:hypothetical protein